MKLSLISKVFKTLSELDFSDYSDNDAINEVLHLFHYSPRVLNDADRDFIVRMKKICSEHQWTSDESLIIFERCKHVRNKGCRPENFHWGDGRNVDGMILTSEAFNDLLDAYALTCMGRPRHQ